MNLLLAIAASSARLLPEPVKKALYRVPPLANLIRSGLNRAVPEGLSEIEVAAGALAGLRLSLDLHNEKDYWLGSYEPHLQAAIAELVKPGMVVYDVGANIGYTTLAFARAVGETGRVYAFEALPDNLERLHTNLRLNPTLGHIEVTPAAVVDQERPVTFLVGPSGAMGKVEGSAGRKDVPYSERLNVSGLCLDQFVYELGNPVPQVVKIDIEGGEVLALPGMKRLIEGVHPIILLELHGQEAAHLAWETLSQNGYRICRMHSGFPTVERLEDLDWKEYLVALYGGPYSGGTQAG